MHLWMFRTHCRPLIWGPHMILHLWQLWEVCVGRTVLPLMALRSTCSQSMCLFFVCSGEVCIGRTVRSVRKKKCPQVKYFGMPWCRVSSASALMLLMTKYSIKLVLYWAVRDTMSSSVSSATLNVILCSSGKWICKRVTGGDDACRRNSNWRQIASSGET